MRIGGNVALVTGGASGLGLATVRILHERMDPTAHLDDILGRAAPRKRRRR